MRRRAMPHTLHAKAACHNSAPLLLVSGPDLACLSGHRSWQRDPSSVSEPVRPALARGPQERPTRPENTRQFRYAHARSDGMTRQDIFSHEQGEKHQSLSCVAAKAPHGRGKSCTVPVGNLVDRMSIAAAPAAVLRASTRNARFLGRLDGERASQRGRLRWPPPVRSGQIGITWKTGIEQL